MPIEKKLAKKKCHGLFQKVEQFVWARTLCFANPPKEYISDLCKKSHQKKNCHGSIQKFKLSRHQFLGRSVQSHVRVLNLPAEKKLAKKKIHGLF